MIRIRNPMALFIPQELGSERDAARHNRNQKEFCPHLYHGLFQGNRPSITFFVQACGMNHLMNEHAGGLFLPIDVDTIR